MAFIWMGSACLPRLDSFEPIPLYDVPMPAFRFRSAPSIFRSMVCALLFALNSAAASQIQPFTADYRATFMGLEATAAMSLTAVPSEDGARWTYRLDIKGAGAHLVQSTTFEIDGEHWRPLSSEDSQRGESGVALLLVKNRSTSSIWDWERGEARWSGDIAPERSAPVPLQAGDLDAMLLNLILVRDIAARKPLRYRLVDDGRAREQRFQRAGTEDINIGGHIRRALKVRREDGNRAITVWVVEGVPAPVRILQQRRGKDHIDLRLIQLPALP